MSAEQAFDLDVLMDKVAGEVREKLPEGEIIALLTEAYSPHWLVVQSILNKEINGKLNALTKEDVSKEGAMLRIAKLQGEIEGIRRFWYVFEEVVTNPVEVKE